MTRSFRDAVVVRLRRLGGIQVSEHTPVPQRGAYVVVIEVPERIALTVGALGRHTLEPGLYAYVGRAKRGLAARIERHMKPQAKRRWHIDHLIAHRAVTPLAAVFFTERDEEECDLAHKLMAMPGASAPIARFGASDCRRGCPAHLVKIG